MVFRMKAAITTQLMDTDLEVPHHLPNPVISVPWEDFLVELLVETVALMTYQRHVPPSGSRPLPSNVVGAL